MPMYMPQISKIEKSLECSDFMMYMTLSAVRDYLGLPYPPRTCMS
jgi:hypothetical protein